MGGSPIAPLIWFIGVMAARYPVKVVEGVRVPYRPPG